MRGQKVKVRKQLYRISVSRFQAPLPKEEEVRKATDEEVCADVLTL
jgi:hypothetical protein